MVPGNAGIGANLFVVVLWLFLSCEFHSVPRSYHQVNYCVISTSCCTTVLKHPSAGRKVGRIMFMQNPLKFHHHYPKLSKD